MLCLMTGTPDSTALHVVVRRYSAYAEVLLAVYPQTTTVAVISFS